jgi:solute:Na+ symporter, SSS family
MILRFIDWAIIVLFFIILLLIGYLASRNSGKSAENFFLSGRGMPWWLLGVSIVATTFANDTPMLITDMVRIGGVASNWMWWAFLITGMLTVFVYAKLWNRSRVMTDNEFYEIRYSGKAAAFLRGFRAVYLGFFYNVLVIAGSVLAFIKMSGVLWGIRPAPALIISSVIVLFYSTLGGLKSIIWTDFFQFSFAMAGAVAAAVYVVRSPEIDGLGNLLHHANVVGKIDFIPSLSQPDIFLSIFIIPLAVQWWAAWYPGSEPGGGGFVVQRMLSAKSENHAMGATFFFNFFHYAVRPWPWIIVALASLIIFPDINSMKAAFPHIDSQFVKNDLAYYAMLRRFLPTGMLGLVIASLIAAYMSTVGSLINWGSSYLVNDFYARFCNPSATEKQKVLFGRISTVSLMTLSVMLAFLLQNALQVFEYMLMIGAGTGLIYILRWFWWRLNAYSELTAMIASTFFSLLFILYENLMKEQLNNGYIPIFGHEVTVTYWNIIKFTGIVILTTLSWLTVTYLTRPEKENILRSFYSRIRPGGPGWAAVVKRASAEGTELVKEKNLRWDVPTGILCMICGCIIIYSLLFSLGNYLYGRTYPAMILGIISLITGIFFIFFWRKLTALSTDPPHLNQ